MKRMSISLALLCLLCTGCAPHKPDSITPVPSPVHRVTDGHVRERAAAPESVQPEKPAPRAEPTRQPPPASYSFETKLTEVSKNRMKNIRKVAERLSGAVIAPDETFSFNRRVGARTAKAGYREAPIIVEGKKEKGVGGGVCQVSSTLYNAALRAGLDIAERHKHSKEVGYVEEGRDATVNYGSLDLKIKNTKATALVIDCAVDDGSVTVTLTEQP